MAVLYAAMTAILAIAFLAFLIEEALRSTSQEEQHDQQAEPTIKLV